MTPTQTVCTLEETHWQDMGHGHIDGITTHYFGIVRTITTLD